MPQGHAKNSAGSRGSRRSRLSLKMPGRGTPRSPAATDLRDILGPMQPTISKNRISRKAASFTESVIREMSREAVKYGAVNLGQGFPDWPGPADIKQKDADAIAADHNQYAITWGVKSF